MPDMSGLGGDEGGFGGIGKEPIASQLYIQSLIQRQTSPSLVVPARAACPTLVEWEETMM